MRGPIYDYKHQRWTEIDTSTDEQTGPHEYVTPDGVRYEVNPDLAAQYRNRLRFTLEEDTAPDHLAECPKKYGDAPTIEQLTAWEFDGVCEATDGCRVELDGTCPHGCRSWFLVLGLI